MATKGAAGFNFFIVQKITVTTPLIVLTDALHGNAVAVKI
jgi:hypothetical protein